MVSGAIANPAVGANPYDVQFCPTNNFIYVANQSPQTVSIIDSATAAVVKTLSLGVDGPSGSAWCPTNNCMYVACYGAGGAANGTVSFSAAAYPVVVGGEGIINSYVGANGGGGAWLQGAAAG